MRQLILALLLFISASVNADEVSCEQLQNTPKMDIDWQTGKSSYFNSNMNKVFRESYIAFTHIDIDGNGIEDTVIRGEGGIRGRYGDYLRIALNEKLDLTQGHEFGREMLTAIHSYPPWPYQDYGVFLARISFINVNDRIYIALKDTKDRGFVVALLSETKPVKYKSPFNDLVLEVLCGIKIDDRP